VAVPPGGKGGRPERRHFLGACSRVGRTSYAYGFDRATATSATTITDPAGKQKRYLNDAFGQLRRVDEPVLIKGVLTLIGEKGGQPESLSE
jgi:hypothetical protein